MRVTETSVLGKAETPKSDAGERTIALGPVLAEELFQHFCHPQKGTALDPKRYGKTLRAAHVDHQRGGSGHGSRGAFHARGSLRLLDDADLHSPRR